MEIPKLPTPSLNRRLTAIVLLAGLLLAGLLWPRSAAAQAEANIDLSAQVGLDGLCKINNWYPVRVRLENNGPAFEGSVAAVVQDFPDEWVYARPMSLAEGAVKEVTILVQSKAHIRQILLRLADEDGPVSEVEFPTNCVQPPTAIIGAFASRASAYNLLTESSFSGSRGSLAQMALEDLPEHVSGLDMVDILIISDVDTGEMTAAQSGALQTWVSNGGRLVVTGGAGWQRTAAGLADLLPFRPQGSLNLEQLDALNQFTLMAEPPAGEVILATGTVAPNASVLATQDNLPVVVHTELGFGEIYYFAFDPSAAPLRSWAGMEDVYRTLLQTQLIRPSWADGFVNWFEADNALSNIPGLGLPSVFLICAFLALYVLIVGPLNFYILHRMHRRELAWVTIPLLVIGFSAAAFLLGLSFRGSRPIINEMSMLQIWPESSQARVDTLLGTFSPQRETYHLRAGPGLVGQPIPGGGLAGSSSWSIEQSVDGIQVPEMRVDVGAIEALATTGGIEAPSFPYELNLSFDQGLARLSGSLQNNSSLPLSDAVFLGPGGYQDDVGDFGPGSRYEIQFSIPGQNASPSGGGKSPNPAPVADSTPADIFGPNYFSSLDDPEMARRFNLFQSAYGSGGSRDGGYYLIGWMDASPIESDLNGQRFQKEALTMVIVSLNPAQTRNTAQSVNLPPSLFTWSVLNQDQSGRIIAPYNSNLYNTSYSLRFSPSQPVQFEEVESLVLHLRSYGSAGPTGMDISLWDFESRSWQQLPQLDWGNHQIPNPERFVGFGGEIRLQLSALASQNAIPIEASDFTLTVR